MPVVGHGLKPELVTLQSASMTQTAAQRSHSCSFSGDKMTRLQSQHSEMDGCSRSARMETWSGLRYTCYHLTPFNSILCQQPTFLCDILDSHLTCISIPFRYCYQTTFKDVCVIQQLSSISVPLKNNLLILGA